MAEILIQATDWTAAANTSSAAAGTTTGAGFGWVDISGFQWNVSASKLVSVNSANIYRGFLLRPASEDCADQRIVVDNTWQSGGTAFAVVRANRTTFDAYAAYFTAGQQLKLVRLNGAASTETILNVASGVTAPVLGTSYRIDLRAIGSTITATWATTAAPGTILGTATATDSALTGGSPGLTHSFTANVTKTSTYNENAPTSTAYTATGPSGGIVNAISTPFTISLVPAGSIPTTDPTVVTPSDGGGGGAFSPNTVSVGSAGNQATFTYTPGTSGIKTISFSDSGGLSDPANLTYTASAQALTPGVISLTAIDSTTLTLSATASVGGTGTLTYQWYRSTSPFTPGPATLLAGKTALTLNDTGLTPETVYFYKLVTTDSLAVTAQPGMFTAVTTIDSREIVLGFIGDSATAYKPTETLADGGTVTMPDMLALALRIYAGNRKVTIVNRAVAGQTTANWLPATSQYINAKAAFLAAGVTEVQLMLGGNDARNITATTPETYRANMQATIDDLVAAGFRVTVHFPNFTVPGSFTNQFDETSMLLVQQYQAQILTLVNGSTVFLGDTKAFTYFAAHQELFVDGAHPRVQGSNVHAKLWLDAIVEHLGLRPPYRRGPAIIGRRI